MPLRATHVAERLVEGELVLYNPASQRVHVLNATAACAWRLCDGRHTEADIVAALAERYPENRQAIQQDIAEMLDLFRAEDLLAT
jgi:Coenzyme PQQ synthesis protein D (PqqD)